MSENETPKPQFLLVFRSPKDAPPESPEEMQATFAKWMQWVEKLVAQGVYLGGNPLEAEGGCVMRGERGQTITDGPFVEGKEILAGYILLQLDNIEQAQQIATDMPDYHLGTSVEVRQVMPI